MCRFLSKNNVQAEVFVATEYGAAVMEPMAGITVHEGRLDEREMEKRLTSDTLLIDATHPYAAAVTDNLRAACAKSGARYERLLRPALPYQNCEIVLNTADAVDWLNAHPGKVLLTTGSKELEAYTAVQDFQTRLFPRVLPTASVLEKCAALGFPGAHIIAMQGPFSQAMNAALLRETTGLPVTLWDERRTTVDAHNILMAGGKNAKQRKKTVDAVAASLMLEGYLTFKKRQK